MLGKVISSLNVLLGIDTRQFASGLSIAEGKLKGFANRVDGIKAPLKAFGAALAAVGASQMIRSVITNLHSTAQAIDDIADSAAKLGMAAGDLMALEHAAKLSGVSMETLTASTAKMVRGISEAQMGQNPKLLSSVAELGLDLDKLARLGPTQQLLSIADAMSGVESQADRLRISVGLFGKSGADMVLILQGGSSELREMISEAERLGLVLDDLATKNVQNLNDSIDRLRGSWEGLKRESTAASAPILSPMLDAATFNVRLLSDMAGKTGESLDDNPLVLAQGIFGVLRLIKDMGARVGVDRMHEGAWRKFREQQVGNLAAADGPMGRFIKTGEAIGSRVEIGAAFHNEGFAEEVGKSIGKVLVNEGGLRDTGENANRDPTVLKMNVGWADVIFAKPRALDIQAQGAGAALKGSFEAFSAIQEFRRAGAGAKDDERNKLLQDVVSTLDKSNKIADKMLAELRTPKLALAEF